uniref:Uncharacterized protein n=1 Tax=Opuntia streptacantha TaxID=393608 RepID=A0A7C9DTC1_OPUST
MEKKHHQNNYKRRRKTKGKNKFKDRTTTSSPQQTRENNKGQIKELITGIDKPLSKVVITRGGSIQLDWQATGDSIIKSLNSLRVTEEWLGCEKNFLLAHLQCRGCDCSRLLSKKQSSTLWIDTGEMS